MVIWCGVATEYWKFWKLFVHDANRRKKTKTNHQLSAREKEHKNRSTLQKVAKHQQQKQQQIRIYWHWIIVIKYFFYYFRSTVRLNWLFIGVCYFVVSCLVLFWFRSSFYWLLWLVCVFIRPTSSIPSFAFAFCFTLIRMSQI